MGQLEAISQELIELFEVAAPPVPIESMLRHPKEGLWEKVDTNQLSGTFLSIRDQFSPRMSLARLLARHVASCAWGRERRLMQLITDEEGLRAFSRMLIMPREMIAALSAGARNPKTMSMHFEVPEDEARQRLQEIAEPG